MFSNNCHGQATIRSISSKMVSNAILPSVGK